VLDSEGKCDEAEKLYRRTLQLRENVLEKEHPNALHSMNNVQYFFEPVATHTANYMFILTGLVIYLHILLSLICLLYLYFAFIEFYLE
jgi:hypothetical protein